MSAVPEMPQDPKLADLAKHLVALHACVHEGQVEFREASAQGRAELAEHRVENRENWTGIQTQIGELGNTVSAR
jgi:hypothetical protein